MLPGLWDLHSSLQQKLLQLLQVVVVVVQVAIPVVPAPVVLQQQAAAAVQAPHQLAQMVWQQCYQGRSQAPCSSSGRARASSHSVVLSGQKISPRVRGMHHRCLSLAQVQHAQPAWALKQHLRSYYCRIHSYRASTMSRQ